MKYRAIVVAVVILLILIVGYTRLLSPHAHPPTIPPIIPSQTQVPGERVSNSTEPEIAAPAVFPTSVTDATGATLQLVEAPKRIVSLAPGATELMFDLGAGDRIVGDTTACDWPPKAAAIRHIGGVFDMSLESILSCKPDLIVADRTINQKIITVLLSAGLHVLVIEPKNLETYYASIRILGKATGETTAAADTINEMRSKFDAVKKSVSKAGLATRVLVMYDTAPIYTSGPGTLIDDIIRIAGGKNVATSNDPMVSEAVIQAQPDVIICAPELEPRIERMPAWKGTVPAVTNTAYFHPAGNATLVRPCKRLTDGAAELARFLHPELFTSDGKPAPIKTTAPVPSGAR